MTKRNEKEKDWIIHYISSGGTCDECGKATTEFLPCICNAHTHGMNQYGHMEFQVILNLGPGLIGYLLNTMGQRVQDGEIFKDGDIITGITATPEGKDLPLRLKEVLSDGVPLLRIILPDENGRFPDDPDCAYIYNLQHLPEELLQKKSEPSA